MSSGCMSSTTALGCIEPGAPIRATYTNLFKWPESDAEFVRSVSSARSDHGGRRTPAAAGGGGGGGECYRYSNGKFRLYSQPRVVDSYSCRQMYLRSYTFSRKETVKERARRCLGKVKDRVVAAAAADHRKKEGEEPKKKKKRGSGVRRLKEVSCSAVCSVFKRLLSCTSSVDVVVDHRNIFQ